jgi:hypothetical protein
MFLLTSHFYSHYSHSAQPKDTPTEAFSVPSNTWPMTWIKKNSTNIYSTQFKCILILYMPLSLQVKLPPFCHQSLTSTPYRNHSYQKYIASHSVLIGLAKIKYSNHQSRIYHLLKLIMKEEKPCSHYFQIPLLILPSTVQFFKPPFNVAPSSTIHSLVPINST